MAVNCAASPPIRVQRILLSATLTHDPERLAALRLRRPRLFAAVSAGTDVTETGLHFGHACC
jgi:hypothetical protein